MHLNSTGESDQNGTSNRCTHQAQRADRHVTRRDDQRILEGRGNADRTRSTVAALGGNLVTPTARRRTAARSASVVLTCDTFPNILDATSKCWNLSESPLRLKT